MQMNVGRVVWEHHGSHERPFKRYYADRHERKRKIDKIERVRTMIGVSERD